MKEEPFDKETGEVLNTRAADGSRLPPPSATMADTIRLLNDGQFDLDVRLLVDLQAARQLDQSGEGHIRFSVEHETKTRTGGTVKVPTMFFIAIPVFAKGPFYRIGARLRYRKTAEGVKFWYDLYRADRSFDHAFDEAVEKVRVETPAAVFFGAPEAA